MYHPRELDREASREVPRRALGAWTSRNNVHFAQPHTRRRSQFDPNCLESRNSCIMVNRK
jgi:hypothetical protein